MNTFIFQSVKDHFDLRQDLSPGKPETWYATRYRSEMHPDDIVHFWMGGSPNIRGLYGWGRLTSEVFIKPKWDSHGVDAVCVEKYANPILAETIEKDSLLADMLIFRAPQATNFLLSPAEATKLANLIKRQGKMAPPTTGGS